jgi:FtsH-binding integral membrane protein
LKIDDEQGAGEWGNFNGLESKEIRRVFIRKVYSILMIQLLITFGLIALFHFTYVFFFFSISQNQSF